MVPYMSDFDASHVRIASLKLHSWWKKIVMSLLVMISCPVGVCEDGDVRLMSGVQCEDYAGRVEVCLEEEWGSICDSHWSNVEASVICGQLGFPPDGKLILM